MSITPAPRTTTAAFKIPSASRRKEVPEPAGRVPRVARLMALAIKFQSLLEEGVVKNQAELAQVGHVTRARMTQVMNLLLLAPDLQEALLHLPEVRHGRDPVSEQDLRPVAAMMDWGRQRAAWKLLHPDQNPIHN